MEEILKKINEILIQEHAKPLENEDNLITDSKLDSFGYAILWIELDEVYKCFPPEYINGIDYKIYKVKDVVERINNAS